MGRFKIGLGFVCVLLVTLMNSSNHAMAQGIERESLSGENVEQQLLQSGDGDKYNLRIGPVTIRADADATLAFNDNIGLTKTSRVADILFTPSGVLHGKWLVSDLNTITLDLGIGYQIYMFNSQYDDLLLSPDSQLQFNFFVGDVAINVHDDFSYQQDPTQIGQLSNTTRLARFSNDAGIGATWDLSAFVLSLEYDHANLWILQSQYKYLTNASDTFSPKISIPVNKSITTGVEASVSNVQYEEDFQNNYISYSMGPFVTANISDYLSFDGRVGGYFADYGTGGANGDSQNVSSFYGSGGVNHKINDAASESLTFGREYLPGLTSNFTDRIYVNYVNTWQVSKAINVGSNLFWESLTDSAAAFSEKSDRYGVGLNAVDNLSQQMTLNLNYQYLLKNANPSDLSYYQNVATVGFQYRF